MNHYSTSSHRRPDADKSSTRALGAYEYYEITGYACPDDYIAAGCPTINPQTGRPISFGGKRARGGAERSTALGYSHISGEKCWPEVYSGVVEVYENDVVVRRPGPATQARGERGQVKGMSRASHARMIQELNQLRWPDGDVLFVTVTWPDEFPADFKQAHALFRALEKRIKYRWPDAERFWRREWKARRMGQNAGKIAPHYHFFLFGVTADEIEFGDWLRRTWSEMSYNGSSEFLDQIIHGTDVVMVHDRAHACRYISKYMAKQDDGEYFLTGRPWGHSAGLDFSPVAVFQFPGEQLLLLRWLLQAFLWASKSLQFAARFQVMSEAHGFHIYIPAGKMLEMLAKLKYRPPNRVSQERTVAA